MADMAKTLGELQPGQSGVVKSVGGGNARVKRRLFDMGVTPMTRIEVRRIAPLGDPIEVSLRGYALSLRREDALEIALLSEQEAAEYQKKEAALRAQGAEPLSHGPDEDVEAHRRAELLTRWAIRSPQGRASGACAACGRCGRGKRARRGALPDAAAPEVDGQPVKFALVGNPHSGKTTLFNALTGAREYVGNWPGVTVEKKERRLHAYGHDITVVDLPGIYSL